jgi:hypothetical protein
LWDQKKKQSTKQKQLLVKRERHQKKRVKLKEEIQFAEKKRRKDGWYMPGEGFNLCLQIVDTDTKLCRTGCGGSDHKTSTSKKCKFNLQNKVEEATRKKNVQDNEIQLLRATIAELEKQSVHNNK